MSDCGSFKYRIKPWHGFFYAVFFGAFAILSFLLASGTEALLTGHRLELQTTLGKLIGYGLSILLATGAGYLLLMVANALMSDIRIMITPDTISAPKGALNNTLITIPFTEVTDLKNMPGSGGDERLIISSDQSNIMIYNKFCRGYDFKTIKRIVRQRIEECSEQEHEPN